MTSGVIPLGLVQLRNFRTLKPLNLAVDAALHRKTGLESLFLAIFLAMIIFSPRLFLNHTLEFPRLPPLKLQFILLNWYGKFRIILDIIFLFNSLLFLLTFSFFPSVALTP